jgi:hypothetical protein
MKKFLFIFSLLFTPFIFGQLAPLHICADTTELKNYDGSGIVLLDSYGKGNVAGGGLFHRIDSTYAEGSNAFDYKKLNGLQWARIGVSSVSATITNATVTTATTGTTITDKLSLDSLVSIGVDAFTTTGVTDTVVISGATTDDIYFVTGNLTSAIDQQDILQWQALTGKLVVHRMASGESALKYAWVRFKTH